MKHSVLVCLAILSLCSVSLQTNAGGIEIHSATFNGYGCNAVFRPGHLIEMRYLARHYSFAAGRDKYEYIVFTLLNKTNKKKTTILQLGRDYIEGKYDDFSFSLMFKTPTEPGVYEISYSPYLLFTRFALGNINADKSLSLTPGDMKYVNDFFEENHHKSNALCNIRISTGIEREEVMPALYLQVNKQFPSQVDMAKASNQIEFSWYMSDKPLTTNKQYRYNLYPDDDGWSLWQTDQFVRYYLINKGSHEFKVESKYIMNGDEHITPVAQYSFTLEQPFLGIPDSQQFYKPGDLLTFVDKGEVKRSTSNPSEIGRKVYDNSKALLIGVDSYTDPAFGPLPFVRNDINATANALSSMGFAVEKTPAKTRDEILTAIRRSLQGLTKNDRLVIYVSSHGYLDQLTSRPMIATNDCKKANSEKAISVREIKDLVDAPAVKGRHILLILDCCTSGVGIMDKATGLSAVKTLATQKGSHIMTAGMSDQNARMYENLQMSVFTHFLVKGLVSKQADYTKDGIVTLGELLIYVQYNVASYTNSAQVPMSGRISGNGEIIFF